MSGDEWVVEIPASKLRTFRAIAEAARDARAGEEACWFDHNGNCQAHGVSPPPCPVGQLDAALTRLYGASGGAA